MAGEEHKLCPAFGNNSLTPALEPRALQVPRGTSGSCGPWSSRAGGICCSLPSVQSVARSSSGFVHFSWGKQERGRSCENARGAASRSRWLFTTWQSGWLRERSASQTTNEADFFFFSLFFFPSVLHYTKGPLAVRCCCSPARGTIWVQLAAAMERVRAHMGHPCCWLRGASGAAQEMSPGWGQQRAPGWPSAQHPLDSCMNYSPVMLLL